MKNLKKISLKEEFLAKEKEENEIKITKINIVDNTYEISFEANKLDKNFKSIYIADEEMASKSQNELLDFIYESLPNDDEDLAIYAYMISEHGEDSAINFYIDQKDSIEIEKGDYDNTYIIRTKGDRYSYTIIMTEDAGEQMARERVLEDLENEPEIFDQNWLSYYIYISNIDRQLIAQEDTDNYINDIKESEPERLIEEAEMYINEYEEADDNIKEELLEKASEILYEKMFNYEYEAMKDPIEYFVNEQGMYTEEELLKASFIQIDYNEATDAAIRDDGWEHFMGEVNYIDSLNVWIME
ncbi:MAG: hypothetical protein ACFFG0_05270 [Candidatus Thorarchaeota archaeon]